MLRINRRARGARRVFVLFAAALRPGGLALHALERAPVRQVLDQPTRDAALGNDGGERMLLVAGTAHAAELFLRPADPAVGGGVGGAAAVRRRTPGPDGSPA